MKDWRRSRVARALRGCFVDSMHDTVGAWCFWFLSPSSGDRFFREDVASLVGTIMRLRAAKASHKVVLSLSGGVASILRGDLDEREVARLVVGTRAGSDDQFEEVCDQYSKGWSYWRDDTERGRGIARRWWYEGRLEQPRLDSFGLPGDDLHLHLVWWTGSYGSFLTLDQYADAIEAWDSGYRMDNNHDNADHHNNRVLNVKASCRRVVRNFYRDLMDGWLGDNPLTFGTKYDLDLSSYGDLIPVDEFREDVANGAFIDYDGHGHPVCNGKMNKATVLPSKLEALPVDATHVMWYNR